MIFLKFLFFLAGIFLAADSCPTEKREKPFPCKVCKPAYNLTCQGLDNGNLDSCLTAKEANVVYKLTKMKNVPGKVCTFSFSCPEGTRAWLENEIYAMGTWCPEDSNMGTSVGIWQIGEFPFLPIYVTAPFEDELACRNPKFYEVGPEDVEYDAEEGVKMSNACEEIQLLSIG
ncbi:hypothetical protein L5515_009516 [Caenorhabditis briggsae]|uniref:Uncharacterized protein n=1 Tax=Caenorhabditis briggsae TaxID=6238 RepID=A0AAE9AAP5_CAEBR|nr:hypothetical protein L3Y34_009689 [Caenorhabditis briggsae]UMM37898.1 hypothetical protein L5515_009516 [Caenorhabditis briggsae]